MEINFENELVASLFEWNMRELTVRDDEYQRYLCSGVNVFEPR